MPIVNIAYNLPDDYYDLHLALNAAKLSAVISDFKEHIRSKLKYDDKMTEEQYKIYESIAEEFNEFVFDYGVEDLL